MDIFYQKYITASSLERAIWWHNFVEINLKKYLTGPTELNNVCACAKSEEVWGLNFLSFSKGFAKHPHILRIFKVVSGYLRLPFKPKVDFVMFSLILVSTFTIFLLLFAMNIRSAHKRNRTYSIDGTIFTHRKFANILFIFKKSQNYLRVISKV